MPATILPRVFLRNTTKSPRLKARRWLSRQAAFGVTSVDANLRPDRPCTAGLFSTDLWWGCTLVFAALLVPAQVHAEAAPAQLQAKAAPTKVHAEAAPAQLQAKAAPAQVHAETAPAIWHLGGALQVSLRHTDNGLEREPAYTPTKTTGFAYDAVLDGAFAVTPRTSVEATLRTRADGNLEAVVVRYTLSDRVVLRAGRDFVNAGGWEGKDRGVAALALSPYVRRQMPWVAAAKAGAHDPPPATAAAASASVAVPGYGTTTLQVLDDVVVGDDVAARFSHTKRQPAALFEWMGNGTALTPLIQIGSYDLNHSVLGAAGLRLAFDGFSAHTGVLIDLRGQPNSTHQSVVTQYRTATVDASYELGVWQIFGKYAASDVVQPENAGGVDHLGNQPGLVFDDNGRSYAAGVRYRLDNDAFAPYAALVGSAGRFLEDAAAPRGAIERKSERGIEFGVVSRF